MAAMLVNNGGVDMAHIKVTSHVAIYQTRRTRKKKLRRQLQGVDTNDPACTAAGCPPSYQGTLCQFIPVYCVPPWCTRTVHYRYWVPTLVLWS